jgi:hypothetical protein
MAGVGDRAVTDQGAGGSLLSEADIIHMYTRAQAIADRVLVDCSHGWLGEMAQQVGVRYPIAMTATAFTTLVQLTTAARAAGNDERGRWWDVLWMYRLAIRGLPPGRTEVRFDVLCIIDERDPTRCTVKAVCGPDDQGSPCLTLMLPEED